MVLIELNVNGQNVNFALAVEVNSS